MRILIAEDNQNVAQEVAKGLRDASHDVELANDGRSAIALVETNTYDVIVMDVMMPVMDGYTAVQHIRRQNITTPVIMLTARGEVEDRVRGLDCGADDYLTKPFSMVELLARIRALGRRQRGDASPTICLRDLVLDIATRTARRGARKIELTNREFALLEFLMSSSPTPVSKAAILEHVWDQHFESASNIVNVYIRHLREKLEVNNEPTLLHTVRGVGFVMK